MKECLDELIKYFDDVANIYEQGDSLFFRLLAFYFNIDSDVSKLFKEGTLTRLDITERKTLWIIMRTLKCYVEHSEDFYHFER